MQHSTFTHVVRSVALPLGIAFVLWLLASAGLRGQHAMAQQVTGHEGGHTAGAIGAQTAHPAPTAGDVIIELSGFTFSPTVVIIEPGQTVTWVRRDGSHNVVADDGSYRSGDVSGDWETFSHTFDAVGESQYFCELHGAAGGSGMAGKVIVQVTGPAGSKLYLPLIAQ